MLGRNILATEHYSRDMMCPIIFAVAVKRKPNNDEQMWPQL